jgi:hypothetical protein
MAIRFVLDFCHTKANTLPETAGDQPELPPCYHNSSANSGGGKPAGSEN